MKENRTYVKYYLVHKDKKSKISYQFDFMVLNQNGESLPFINIYLFHDQTNNHRHFIITPDGNLEVAHYEYKNDWKPKDKSIPKIELLRPIRYYKQFCNVFKGDIALESAIFSKSIKCDVLIEPIYIYLMQSAVDNFFQSQDNYIWDLFTIINPKNELIPLSEEKRKIKKK